MEAGFVRQVLVDWEKVPPDSYLREIPSLRGLRRLAFSRAVTFFVGENGSGKSTLLEAMAVAYGFNPEGGTRNYSFSPRDTHSGLHEALRLVKGSRRAMHGYFLRAESFYNVATQEEAYADGAHPSRRYHERSHGESFLAIAQDYLRPGGLYFFDEPEAGIDLWSFQNLIHVFEKMHEEIQGSILIISHQERILNIADRIILLADGQIKKTGSKEEVMPELLGTGAHCKTLTDKL